MVAQRLHISFAAITGAIAATFVAATAGAAVAVTPRTAVAGIAGAVIALALLVRPRVSVLVLLPVSLLVPPFVAFHLRAFPDQTPTRALVVVSSVAMLGFGVLRRRPLIPLPAAVLRVVTVFLAYLAVLFLAHPSIASFRGMLALGLGAFAPALLTTWLVTTPNCAFRLTATLVAVMDVAALVAVLEEMLGRHLFAAHAGTFFHADSRSGWLRAQGVFPHPIVLGAALALTLPFALALAFGHRHHLRILGRVSIPLQLLALAMTVSRGPWIAAAAGIVVVAALLQRDFVQHTMILAAVVLAAAFSPVGKAVGHATASLLHPQARQDAYVVDYRKQLLRQSLAEARKHPFASRLALDDTVVLNGSVEGASVNLGVSQDNTYVYYLLKLGAPGALLLVAILLLIPGITLRRLPPPGAELRRIAAAAVASELALLVVAATVATLSWEQLGVLFWLIAGLGYSACALGGRSNA